MATATCTTVLASVKLLRRTTGSQLRRETFVNTRSQIGLATAAVALGLLGGVYGVRSWNSSSGSAAGRHDQSATTPHHEPVTAETREAALRATVSCLQASGITAYVAPARAQRPASISMSARSVADVAGGEAAYQSCRSRNSLEIETAWLIQNQPDQGEQSAAARAFATCMTSAGVAGVGDSVTTAQQREWFGFNGTSNWGDSERTRHAAATKCLLQVEEDLGVRP